MWIHTLCVSYTQFTKQNQFSMSFSLMDAFKDQVQGALIQQASSYLGESEGGLQKAMGAVVPGLLGGLISKGSTVNGASSILDFMNNNQMDTGMLSNLGGLFSGGSSTDGLMSTGSMIMKFIMGDKVGALTDFIVSKAGIKSGAASSIIKMAAPMVMGLLSKQVAGNGLNASGLMNLLLGQKEQVAKAAPSGLGDLLGLGGLFSGAQSAVSGLAGGVKDTASSLADGTKDAAGKAAGAVTGAAGKIGDTVRNVEPPSGGGGFGKILPYIIGLAALLGVLYFVGGEGCAKKAVDGVGDAVEKTGEMAKDGVAAVGDAAGDAANAVGDVAGDAADAVGDAANAVVDAITSISLPGGAEIKAEAGSFTDRIARYLSGEDVEGVTDGIIAFDKVNFETGKADLTAESMTQLENLAAIMKAYPNVEIEVQGHTDNTGDAAANMTLSKQRALSVKQALTAQLGINQNRVAAEGYGQNNPIASNDTAEGRAENRRVVAKVTKR